MELSTLELNRPANLERITGHTTGRALSEHCVERTTAVEALSVT